MRKLFLSLATLLVSCGLFAQTPSRSLLWEVSGKDLSSPSYILGTIHMICPDDLIWSPAMEKSLKTAKLVCLELDLDDPETIGKIMKGMGTGSGKSLRQSMNPADYARLKTFAQDSAHIDIASLDDADPATLPMKFISSLLSCKTAASYEAKIAVEAIGASKEIVGIESAEEQLALLKILMDDTGTDGVLKMVDSFNVLRRQFADMVRLYRAQDLDGLNALIQSSPVLGGQTDALLRDRNHKWIPRLEKLLPRGPLFIAVGAGHLPGKDGILQLLRNAGYDVRPM